MIRFGLKIEGDSFLSWYGCEMSSREKEILVQQYGPEEKVELLDICQDAFSGFPIGEDPAALAERIRMFYYFPDEETPEALSPDRRIDLSAAEIRILTNRRKRCEAGHVFAAGGEISAGQTMTLLFDSGFLPPFEPRDVTLILEDLSDFGRPGYILTGAEYRFLRPDCVETEFRFGRRLPTRFLED